MSCTRLTFVKIRNPKALLKPFYITGSFRTSLLHKSNMNSSNSSSEVIFFDNFPIIIISTVYPTFFLGLCILTVISYRWGQLSSFKRKSLVVPIESIALKGLADNVNSNIAEIPIMKPDLRLLGDTIDPVDIRNQSSTFYRMKIYDLGTEFAKSHVQAVTYPYPQFSEFLNYHLLECSCLRAEEDIIVAQRAKELYDQAVIGPSEFSLAQVTSFQERLSVLNERLSHCSYSNQWK